MESNWNEQEAEKQNKLSCKDCRFFNPGCIDNKSKWHKTCNDFDWW